MQYVPLHIHTENSLLDGAIRIKEYCQFAKDNDIPAIAMADHGVMYGAVEFYKTAKDMGVKPLIGCEFYVYDGDITEKNSSKTETFHLVLIAKNLDGYKNLVKLVSIAQIDGFYYKPRINHKYIEEYSEGLICLSACLQGEVAKAITDGKRDKAREIAKYYQSVFKNDYYLEIQDHGIDKQKRSNPEIIKIAKELGIKLVITNDSHYLRKEDADWHDTLLCIQTSSLKAEENRFRFPNNEFYVKTPEELRDAFSWLDAETFNEAIANTVEVAEKCHLILEMGKTNLPHYEVPANHTLDSYLDFKVREGLEAKYEKITPEIEERVKYELGVISNMGFSAYFLITWDFINYAKSNGIPVGPGRGSAAGSLVAYALGITDLDPMFHKLLFERFLNPERVSMPDIDIDFCIERRSEVIDYVSRKYGADKVCQIITFGTLAARNAIKSVARAYEMSFAESNKISQLVPNAPGSKLKDGLQDGMELKTLYDTNPEIKKVIDMALKIEDIKYNTGIHAAGVVISKLPLNDVVPLQYSKDGKVITEYAMNDSSEIGLLKMDFLGLRNLTMISKALKMIKVRHNIDLDINHIPLDDKDVYEMLSKGETDGVFQLESSGMKKLVRDLKPSVFEDISALVALFRPGPLSTGMVDDFVARKHGRQKVEYAVPELEPILGDTYGTMVYQEQIMQIARVMGGYTLGQADELRRAMGKKNHEKMEKNKGKFIEGSIKNGFPEKVAAELFDKMAQFAAYCFNRSHTVAYAFIAYQTAYLKSHYPVEYMAAILSSVSSDQDKTQLYISECQNLGIKVLPPDINKSFSEFAPDKDDIRFGFASIKNVGKSIIDGIIEERKNGEYKSFYDFCSRVDMKCLNKRTIESLIRAGAFSNIEKSRKQLIENIDNVIESAARVQDAKNKGQANLFGGFGELSSGNQEYELYGTDEEYEDKQIQMFEKEYLGFYVTSHPLSSIRDKIPFLTTHNIADMEELPNEKFVTICGLLSQVRQIPTKKDPTKFLKAGIIEDLTGKIEFVAFHKTLQEYNSLLEPELKVIISGKLQKNGEDQMSIVVDNVKPVDNSNIVTLALDKEMKFEEIMHVKDILQDYKGSDPVMFELKQDDNTKTKILTSSSFWVTASNDLKEVLQNNFKEKIAVSIKSLDE